MLEGALIALGSIIVGRLLVQFPPRRRTPKSVAPPKPICDGCGHGRSYHKDGGSCTAEDRANSTERGYYMQACTCAEYTGPVPLQTFYSPEIGA